MFLGFFCLFFCRTSSSISLYNCSAADLCHVCCLYWDYLVTEMLCVVVAGGECGDSGPVHWTGSGEAAGPAQQPVGPAPEDCAQTDIPTGTHSVHTVSHVLFILIQFFPLPECFLNILQYVSPQSSPQRATIMPAKKQRRPILFSIQSSHWKQMYSWQEYALLSTGVSPRSTAQMRRTRAVASAEHMLGDFHAFKGLSIDHKFLLY